MKKLFLIICAACFLSLLFANAQRNLPKTFSAEQPVRLHQKLKEIIKNSKWEKVSSIITTNKLVIKDNRCFIKWKDKICPLGFSVEAAKSQKEIRYKAEKILLNNDIYFLKYKFKNTILNVVIKPETNLIKITSLITSTTDLAVRVGWQVDIPEKEVKWHYNIYKEIITDNIKDYKCVKQTNLGIYGEQSIYPLAVISKSKLVMSAFVDVSEPVFFSLIFHKEKQTASLQFYFDAMLSKTTTKAKLCAAHSGAIAFLKSDKPFRAALQLYYKTYPEKFNSAKPIYAGNWLPFTNPNTIPNVDDFFFSAHECHNADLTFNQRHNIGTFYYIEPWLGWIKMPSSVKRNSSAVMKILNKMLTDNSNDFASAIFLSARRDRNNKMMFKFLNMPWCNGARIELFPLPDTRTTKKFKTNHAQFVWNSIRKRLEDKRVAGIYVDSMNANSSLSYDTNQLAATDFPAIFRTGENIAGLHGSVALFEFCEVLADILHKNKLQIMGNFPIDTFAFIPQFVDIPGQETAWLYNNNYQPLSDDKMFYCRAMSGKKPYLLLQCCDFFKFKPFVEKYFARCAAMGFFPSMFSYDSANSPYWNNSKLYNRDRKLFKKYLPLIQKLAKEGWQPLPNAKTCSNVWLEQFGTTATNYWLTLYNPNEKDESGYFEIKNRKLNAYLLPSKKIIQRESNGKFPFKLCSGEVWIINIRD